jgi:glycosyltransferase involved in cell wall biosynthesis
VIRVGFIINFDDREWLGGTSYFRNLIDAIQSMPERKIDPVILTSYGKKVQFPGSFFSAELVRSRLFLESHPAYVFRKVWRRLFSYDLILERFLIEQRIDVLSHAEFIGKNASIPVIGWIPDFQHKYLPEFFSLEEIKERDRGFELTIGRSSCVILSSYEARKDAERFYLSYKTKFRVLHFVAGGMNKGSVSDIQMLEDKYGFCKPYFLLPNQFWIHKNHKTVIEALRILRFQHRNILILVTGNTNDYRQPDYYSSLVSMARDYGVLDSFRVLGIVPYQDLVSLMSHSISLINPSLFEGWSTTVEEAKSLGKQIILSDIPVHREQAPEGGVFFQPEDAYALADILWDLQISYDIGLDKERMFQAQEKLIKRKHEFAKSYENIVLDVIDAR